MSMEAHGNFINFPFRIVPVFTMTALDPTLAKKHPFPCPTTYRSALTFYLDIMSSPIETIV
jgi:FAD binding domain.